ncbi:hypothetical protein EFK50_02295 [Nocardioides marmoriginsengisoli]|uniref:Uncharacterized protein n=1 Tax=Nocardioides marmoriginsengisoli TaxID=661483 RepID=A0A3N0CNG3_9ACTN|nr:hypothetical protein [Nocardioides marmoriginsengisoli]RNL64841.1 hypothetical protein EFK50_02295 [Nocardioides marmoriginsengisoli]
MKTYAPPSARRRRRLGAVAAAAALALTPVAAANAATIISLDHDVSGSTYIKSTNSTVRLGPGTLHTDLDIDTGDFTGSLTLPGTRTRFAALGLVPLEANIDFIPAGPVTGHINLAGENAEVSATAKFYVKLSNIKAIGLLPLWWFGGSTCRTVNPVSIPANTPPGEGFDLINGGRLTGTYTIGQFQNCGLLTPFVNLLVPGAGNTVTLQATNGRVS